MQRTAVTKEPLNVDIHIFLNNRIRVCSLILFKSRDSFCVWKQKCARETPTISGKIDASQLSHMLIAVSSEY
jgi:hypothetical protein